MMKWCDENYVGSSSKHLKLPIERERDQPSCREWLLQFVKKHHIPCFSLEDPSLKPPLEQPNHYYVKSTYWYDMETKEKTWVMPSILKYIGDVPCIDIPPSKRDYNPKCSFCIKWRKHERNKSVHLASLHCVECDEVFCNFCFEKSHMFSAKHHRSETMINHFIFQRYNGRIDTGVEGLCNAYDHALNEVERLKIQVKNAHLETLDGLTQWELERQEMVKKLLNLSISSE